MSASKRWRRFRLCCRVTGGLFLAALLIAFALLAWINSTSGKSWVTQQINSRIPGTLSFTHFEFTLADGVRLGDVRYEHVVSGRVFEANCRAFDVRDFLWGTASARIYDGTVTIDREPFVVAEQLDWQLPATENETAMRVTVRDGSIMPEALRANRIDPEQFIGPPAPAEFREQTPFPELELQVDRVQVRSSVITGSPLWRGRLLIHEDLARIEYDLHGVAENEEQETRRIDLQGVLHPNENWALESELTAQSFPLLLESMLGIRAEVSGLVESVRHPDVPLALRGDVQLADVSTVFSATQGIDTAWALVRAETALATGYAVNSVTSSISHAAVTWNNGNGNAWMLPQGHLTAFVNVLSATEARTAVGWASDDLGQATASASVWPLNATSPVTVDFSVPSRALDDLRLFLPEPIVNLFRGLSGSLGASGRVALGGDGTPVIDTTVNLSGGSYAVGPLVMEDMRLSVDVDSQTGGIGARIQGSATFGFLQSGEVVYTLEAVPFSGSATYTFADSALTVDLRSEPTGPFSAIAFRMDPSMNWSVTGGFDVEAGIASVMAAYLPWVERAVEGMGNVSWALNGTGSAIDMQLSSEDLVLYSFDAEPSFGAQMRNVAMSGSIRPAAGDAQSFEARIQAATPYISYDGGEMEWASEIISTTVRMEDMGSNDWTVTAEPPGGGEFTWTRSDVASAYLGTDLSMEAFVVPVLNQLLLQDDEPFWDADGLLSVDANLGNVAGEPVWRGTIELNSMDAVYRPEPGITLRDARLSVPFSYPPSYDLLPGTDIVFHAESVRIRNATFEEPIVTLAIEPDEIAYVTPWSIPIYGGLLQLQDLRVRNWQSEAPSLGGVIRVNDMDMQRAHSFLPFLPYPGTITGELELTTVSSEVVEASGSLNADVFDGSIVMSRVAISNPLSGQRIFELDADFNRIDLDRLVKFFEFGEMTGRVNGYARNLRILQPTAGSSEWPQPLAFDIELRSVDKGNWMINRSTLEKIVNMGEQTQLTRMVVERERYLYTEMGLHANLQGNQMRLYGTLRDDFFLASDITKGIEQLFKPSEWFQIPINIKLASPEDVIPFEPVWQRLKGQAGG